MISVEDNNKNIIKDDVPIQSLKPSNLFVKIQSVNSKDSTGKPYFVTKGEGNNLNCSVSSQVLPLDQLFQLTQDGHILSQIGNKVLDVSSNNVVLNDWDTKSKSQIWVFDLSTKTIKNTGANLYLSFDSSSLNLMVSSTSEQWYFGPTYPLISIMKQPSTPFPSFTGNQNSAYTWISEQLGGKQCTSIRSQYTNITLVPSYANQIIGLSYPSGQSFSETDFTTVKSQVNLELNYANAIINLFNYYNGFHKDLFSQTEAVLNKLEAACGLDAGSKTEFAYGWMLTLFSGLVCTVIDLVPEFGPPIANFIQTGVDTTVEVVDAIQNYNTIFAPSPFNVALYQLWDFLIKNFNAILSTLSGIEKDVLSDWGRMCATYTAMQLPPGLDSLAWTPQTNTSSMGPALSANTVSLSQMLLPSKYTIFAATSNEDKPSKLYPYMNFKNNDIIYFIGESDNPLVFPSESLMNEIWDLKVTPLDFYTGNFGWNFPIAYYVSSGYDFVTPTFSNNTNIPMDVTIQYDNDNYVGHLHTYSSYTYIKNNSNPALDKNVTVTIKDKNGNLVVSFKLTYDSGVPGAKNFTYGNNNFQINGPIVKNKGDGCSAAINISINYVQYPINSNNNN